jgi:hypothetical protein
LVGGCYYLRIGLSLYGANLLLQLKISHKLADFDVIDKVLNAIFRLVNEPTHSTARSILVWLSLT